MQPKDQNQKPVLDRIILIGGFVIVLVQFTGKYPNEVILGTILAIASIFILQHKFSNGNSQLIKLFGIIMLLASLLIFYHYPPILRIPDPEPDEKPIDEEIEEQGQKEAEEFKAGLELSLNKLALDENNIELKNKIQAYFINNAEVYLTTQELTAHEGTIEGFLSRLNNRKKNYTFEVLNEYEELEIPLKKLEYSRYENK